MIKSGGKEIFLKILVTEIHNEHCAVLKSQLGHKTN